MRPVLEIGWPDEMQARQIIIAECEKLGTKTKFCKAVGIRPDYLSLILSWSRTAAHDKIIAYFGWRAVYVRAEDIEDRKERRRLAQRPLGQPNDALLPCVDVLTASQREYWRRKQRESRLRRRLRD